MIHIDLKHQQKFQILEQMACLVIESDLIELSASLLDNGVGLNALIC